MARPYLKITLPDAFTEFSDLYAGESDPWIKNRLLALQLASRGSHSAAEVAATCGMARGHLFSLIKMARDKGIQALLQREKPGPKAGSFRGLAPAVVAQFKAKRMKQEFKSARDAQMWLKEVHGLTKSYRTVWRWVHKPDSAG